MIHEFYPGASITPGLPYRPENSEHVRNFMSNFVRKEFKKKTRMSGILVSTQSNVQFFREHIDYGTKIANSESDFKQRPFFGLRPRFIDLIYFQKFFSLVRLCLSGISPIQI